MHGDHEHNHHKRSLKHRLHETFSGEKTRTPRQKRSIETRNLVIEAAMKLFSEKGYHNTNSKEIAAEAGVATGCFYSYFTDKRAVFMEALKIYHRQFNEIVQIHLDRADEFGNDRRAFLYQLIQGLIDAHRIFSGFHNELQALKFSDPDIQKIIDDEMLDSRKNSIHFMQRWKGEMSAPDFEAAATVVFEAIDSVVDAINDKKSGLEDNRLIQATIDMVTKYLYE